MTSISQEAANMMQKRVKELAVKSLPGNHIPVGGFNKKGRPDLEKAQQELHYSHVLGTKMPKTVMTASDGTVSIPIKPLSVNQGYTGRKFKTKAHRAWKSEVNSLLPEMKIDKHDFYRIEFTFGLSSEVSDYDNCIKFIQDLIAKKYKFNDKKIHKAIIDIHIVSKGHEYIKFKVSAL